MADSSRAHLSPLDTNFTISVQEDLELPPVRISTSPRHTAGQNSPPFANTRARNEARKLLSHVLVQLANRSKPPSIVDAITNATNDSAERGFGAFAESLREAVKLGNNQSLKSKQNSETFEDDSDDDGSVIFATDRTLDLLTQLKDVITMAIAQGWQIFDDSSLWKDGPHDADSKLPSPFRSSRHSSKSGSVHPRSASHHSRKGQLHVPELLSLCVSVLGSIVAEDCRYRVVFPRPSRPPNALQILTLNIAQFLLHTHQHDPYVISQVTFAILPAFYTFHSQMYPRLLTFMETSVIRIVLQNLGRLRQNIVTKRYAEPSHETLLPSNFQQNPPLLSIQIDEVESNTTQSTGGWTPSSPFTLSTMAVQSANDPHQTPQIYELAFLIPPVLGAILDTLDATSSTIGSEIHTQFDNLIDLLASSKLDLYNDLLEIIAYRGHDSRRLAIASLAKLWPKAVGHTVISRPLFSSDSVRIPENAYAHQFMPWHFNPNYRQVRVNETLHDSCRSCSKVIDGFALLCPYCVTAVHFECYDYDEGNYEVQYSMIDDPRMQRVAMCRFSYLDADRRTSRREIPGDRHIFQVANWFTLCLCFVCRKPLWGYLSQGLKCQRCPIALHLNCRGTLNAHSSSKPCGIVVTSDDMTIDWAELRSSCLEYFPILKSTRDQLRRSSYEEISIFLGVLRTQLHILINGIAFGTLVVLQNGVHVMHDREHDIEPFELHATVKACEELVDSNQLAISSMTQQFIEDTNMEMIKPSIMFDWSYLEYVTSAVKSSLPHNGDHHHSASEFLSINDPIDHLATPDRIAHPYVSAPLSHLRSILGLDFSLHSDQGTKFLLNHLQHLSFVERQDRSSGSFQDLTLEKDVPCVFPLPLGLDLSTNVETLVCAVESSLSDLDLSTNEFGFLLLTRRFWPSGLASEYGLKRLTSGIISWILDEDSNLAIILREFVAKQRNLPGVRPPQSPVPWPASQNTRSPPTSTASNGGDFVSARRSLLSRFALPWLSRLHALDPSFYCQTLFDTCSEIVEAGDLEPDAISGSAIRENDQHSRLCDNLLRSIIKLSQNSVVFGVYNALLLRWLHSVFARGVIDKPLPSVHRLFIQENDPLQLSSITGDSINADVPYSPTADPLGAVLDFARESESSISPALLYLTMIVKSGVDISTATFTHFFAIIASNTLDGLANANILIRSIILSLWQRSLGRQDLQSLVASIHGHFSSHISQSLVSGENFLVAISIIRQSLAACLLICGCERASILALGMVDINEIQDLPSRRKLTVRGSILEDPIIIQSEILNALQLYLQSSLDDVSRLVAKFLNLFLVESPFLESFEVDNFILRNGKLIALCLWTTYGNQQEDLMAVRTNLFLRSVVVDSEPLQELVQGCLDPASNCIQQRLSGLNRLFRIISDVTSPAFNVEGRQWRSSVTCIFHFYFSSLWADPSEEIRMAVRSYSAALLPAHFKVISQCWNASLSTAPIAERIRLVGFLIQLRPHFPGWKVVSWDIVIDTLMEYEYDLHSSQKNNGKFYRLSTTDPDMAHLRISLILLSLQMVADGVAIDSFSLMKIKVQFIQLAGFSTISVIPTQNGQSFHLQFGDIEELSESAYACAEELVRVVDAPYHVDLPRSVLGHVDGNEDEPFNVLVGSPFVDVSLCMLSTLRNLALLPILTLKAVLETLYIILHKYDFEDHRFRHLQPLLRKAVVRASELLSEDVGYEPRQLALSIAQASIKKCHGFLGATISIILDLVAAEVASQVHSSQDSLVVHGKTLIENTLHSFCNQGLLLNLLKRPRPIEFFAVLYQVFNVQNKEVNVVPAAICDLLVRDTLARVVDCDLGSFQISLLNLSSFIEYVYFQDYSLDLINFIGQHLVHLVRRMSDGTIVGADSSPLIAISVVVLEHHPVYAKDLLLNVETVLRVSLNRLLVSKSSLTRLVRVSSSQRFKTQELVSTMDPINVLYDVLLDGFRMKTKMVPLTLMSLIETLLSKDDPDVDSPSETHMHLFQNLLEDASTFLQNHIWLEDGIDHEFEAVRATARLLLLGCSRDPTVFQKFTESSSDSKPPRTPLTIRSWNILVLAALQESREDYKSLIYAHFSKFGSAYSNLLRTYVYSGISSSVTATTDINQAHIAIKLWLMLAHSMSIMAKNGEGSVSTVWNELWPAYEGFLNVLETEAQVGQYPTLISLASTSVADLLTYLYSLKTSLSLDTSAHVAILTRLRMLSRGDSSSGKIARAIRAISEPQPEIGAKILLDQIAKELVAAEKIRIAESKRDTPKVVGDKFKKEGKLLTT